MHFAQINELQATIADLEEKLTAMTRSRDFFEGELKKKEAEFDQLMDKFELKCSELVKEK